MVEQREQGKQGNQSVEAIEADIEATRQRLAGTIDELAFRAQPKEILRRQLEAARTSFYQATHTPEGDVRVERVGALAAAAVLLVSLAVWRRRRG